MVLVVSPYSYFEFGSYNISTFEVFGNLVYVGLYDGSLDVCQLPTGGETQMTQFDESKLVLEDLNVVARTKLSCRAMQLELIPNLGYLVALLENQTVEIYSLNDYQFIDKFDEARFNLIKTWYEDDKELQFDQINEEDNDYITVDDNDSISLATTALETIRTKKFVTSVTGNSYLCLISKRNIAVMKWHDNQYERKYEYKLNDKIQVVEFLNSDGLIVALKNGDILKIDLAHDSVSIIQIQFLNQPTGFSKSFFFSPSDSLLEIFKANNDQQLIIMKDYNLIKLNSDLELVVYRRHTHSIDFKNPVLVPSHNQSGKKLRFLKYWFPYVVLVYTNSLEIRNLENGSVVQQLQGTPTFSGITSIKFTPKFMFLVCNSTVYKLVKTTYDSQLAEFEKSKDYNNAINLIEKLNPLAFEDISEDHSSRQIKFTRLRQFELLKGLEYLKSENYETGIKLFVEFLAPPELLLDNLPESVKTLLSGNSSLKHAASKESLKSDKEPETKTNQDIKIINQVISFLTDARRKLTRLLDPDSPRFLWHGFLISRELYGSKDISKLEQKLQTVDDCLFQCYLITNPRMVGPLLRISNYCSFDRIEKNCLELKLYTELIDFYYCRSRHDKALELLEKLCISEHVFEPKFMVKYIQKLGQPQLDLIFKYSEKLISLDQTNVESIFMDDSIECESLNKQQVLDFLNKWPSLQVRYLRYLIFDLGETNIKFPNKLIELYLQDPAKNQAHINQIYSLNNYNPSFVLKKLNSLKQSPVVLELMILPLGKLNKHKEVLEILVHRLNDIEKALNYCRAVHSSSQETGIKLTYMLLDMLLPSNDYDSVFQILDSGITYLDPVEVLEKLPRSLQLGRLEGYLESNIRNIMSDLRSDIIKSELLKVQLINLKYEKLLSDTAHVRIDASSKCVVCDKNFAASSILSFFPDGSVVHYSCSKYRN
ncbi:hypothetical protein KL919_000444 [Ogataea angusta]|nr:hypothetical protein KL919_000444 [Ogataea angusta]